MAIMFFSLVIMGLYRRLWGFISDIRFLHRLWDLSAVMVFISVYGFYQRLCLFTRDYCFLPGIIGFYCRLWVFIADYGFYC